MALEMTLDEVQTALDLYPFPSLNTHFKRDTLISIAIKNKKSIDELDEWLSIADLSILSRSKTEDLGIFPPNRSTNKSKDKVYSNHRETNFTERSIHMEVLSERCTSTLMCDGMYAYDAEMAIRNDENNIVYIHANYSYGDHFTVADASIYDWMTTESDEEPNVTFIEEYEDLESALSSKYADFFSRLDKMTDDTKNKADNYDDDTANFGWRCVGKFEDVGLILFCEVYGAEEKKYAQVQYFTLSNKYLFSVSKESYFKLFELGEELYEIMMGYKKTVNFIEKEVTLEQAENSIYKPAFLWLKNKVEQYEKYLENQ